MLLFLLSVAAVYDLYAPLTDPMYELLEFRRLISSVDEEVRLLFWRNNQRATCLDENCELPRRLNDTHVALTTPLEWRCDPRASVIGVFNKESELCALFPGFHTTCGVLKEQWRIEWSTLSTFVLVMCVVWLACILVTLYKLRAIRTSENQFHHE